MIPINVDTNVSRRAYENLSPDELLVTKVFYTIQGEGPFAGLQAVFIRLAGCNIGAKVDCPWCDTAFALADGTPTKFDALADVIMHNPNARVVVFTGGEPLLQHSSVLCFMDAFRRRHRGRYSSLHWQMETNGMLLRDDNIDTVSDRDMLYVVSPKIPHGLGHYRSTKEMVLSRRDRIALKYVVSADPSSPYHEVRDDTADLAIALGVPVYISGMTSYKKTPPGVASVWDAEVVDQDTTAAHYAHAARLVMRTPGTRLSYQTHLFGAIE